MIPNAPIERRLYALMADDRSAPRAGDGSSAQKMADALSLWRAGDRNASTREQFCAGLKETLERLVRDNDVDLRKAILQHRFPKVKDYRLLVASPKCEAALQAAKKLRDLAHPARIEREPDPARKSHLEALAAAVDDARAGRGDWARVTAGACALGEKTAADFAPHADVLAEKQELERDASVIEYLAQRAPHHSRSGGGARGRDVEDRVGTALTQLCNAMNEATASSEDPGYRIVRGANVPPALRPADSRHVKGELDFLLMHGNDVVLVGETKAGGATAIGADCLKLRNAVVEMAARAQQDRAYAFILGSDKRSAAAGEKGKPQVLQVSGESLQRLAAAPGDAPDVQPTWPASARYFLPDAVTGIPLSQRAVAYLTWRPASLDYAQALFDGAQPSIEGLESVWRELGEDPKLAWIWEERALAEQALNAVHGSESIAGFTAAFAQMKPGS